MSEKDKAKEESAKKLGKTVAEMEAAGSKYCLATNPPSPDDCGNPAPHDPHWW